MNVKNKIYNFLWWILIVDRKMNDMAISSK